MRSVKLLAAVGVFGLFASAAHANGSLFGPFQWEGVYFGVNTGAATGSVSMNPDVAPDPFGGNSLSPSGGFGGLDFAINRQFRNIVFGFAADAMMPSLNGNGGWYEDDSTDNPWSTKTQLLATFRGRFGYAFGNVLPYVTGGAAYQDTHIVWKYEPGTFDEVIGNFQPNKWGWVIGAGLEYGLHKNWTLGLEYLYMDFGSKHNSTIVFSDDGSSYVGGNIASHTQVVKFSFKYNFGAPAPSP